MNIQKIKKLLPFVAFIAIAIVGFGVSNNALAQKAAKKTKMDTPAISAGTVSSVSIDIVVTAGATGAPAGFSLQWMTAADYAANGNMWYASDDPRLCKASFSGNANNSTYNLGANQSVTVNIGDFLFDNAGASSNCASIPLECDTEYLFRAFAHANSSLQRSEFTANLSVTTLPCNSTTGCTFTQGYWKTHGPVPTGNNTNQWPVTSLTLGTVGYTDLQLQSIFDTPAAGNGLISLSHQLIAAKLNIANGADGSSIAGAITAADALIGGLVVPPVGSGNLPSSATSSLNGTLTSYNEGLIGPGHCQ